MAHIYVTDHHGTEHRLDAVEGWRVMEIIREHGLPLGGECGGACECATCHVYVDADWLPRLYPRHDEEEGALDRLYEAAETSRLSCQILYSADLAGLRLRLAPA
jgi:2Fe-2S ferredoxin